MQLSPHIAQKSTPTQILYNISHRVDMIRQHDIYINWIWNLNPKPNILLTFATHIFQNILKHLSSTFHVVLCYVEQPTFLLKTKVPSHLWWISTTKRWPPFWSCWSVPWYRGDLVKQYLFYTQMIEFSNEYIYDLIIWIHDICAFIFANSKCLYIYIFLFIYNTDGENKYFLSMSYLDPILKSRGASVLGEMVWWFCFRLNDFKSSWLWSAIVFFEIHLVYVKHCI